MEVTIRKAAPDDYSAIETLTRESFWNVYKPGCNEHLIVHNIHKENKSISDLELVATKNNKVIGHIIYTIGSISGLDNDEKLISFGPISVDSTFQKKGVGNKLISFSLEKATKLGYSAVLITGNPNYYNRFGFTSASKYNIHLKGIPQEDEAPFFMVKELKNATLSNISGIYNFDSVFNVTQTEVDEFDKSFPPKVKEKRKEQLFQ